MPLTAIPVAQYYEVIDSGTAAVAPGDAVSFSQDGVITETPQNIGISRVNDTTFQINSTADFAVSYRIFWQVGVANSGQLGVSIGGSSTLVGVVGTSWGHSQIIGDYVYTVPQNTNATISIVNPSANSSSLNLLSHGSGNIDVLVSLTIFQLVMG